MKKVYIPRDPHEKAMQRALMQFRNPKLRPLVEEALILTGREDLIGYGPKCLIRPPEPKREKNRSHPGSPDREKNRRQNQTNSKHTRRKKH